MEEPTNLSKFPPLALYSKVVFCLLFDLRSTSTNYHGFKNIRRSLVLPVSKHGRSGWTNILQITVPPPLVPLLVLVVRRESAVVAFRVLFDAAALRLV